MKKNVFLVWLSGLIITSCAIPQKMVYLKDMRPEYLYQMVQRTELKVQPDDRLKIVISSMTPTLTVPFNLGLGGFQVSQEGDVSTTSSATSQERGYLVDRQGNIEFPLLGILPVAGRTKAEVAYLIKARLRDGNYVPDAMVTVDILNFKIMMIGEVGGTGVMTVSEEKITLLEAIFRAGGVTANASMAEVMVIREEKNGLRAYMNNINTVDVLNSPTFYLQQNDIVYIKPKAPQRTMREDRFWQYYSLLFGVGSTLLTLLLYINTFKK
ncbi:MAG: polysaccharide biosynthesis/export family protein [Tannerella sp.]|jgi:polysaccharide export outer membrane protein|nr:polysaccharide biosynthesis/export family protein [Tannerella sp.]